MWKLSSQVFISLQLSSKIILTVPCKVTHKFCLYGFLMSALFLQQLRVSFCDILTSVVGEFNYWLCMRLNILRNLWGSKSPIGLLWSILVPYLFTLPRGDLLVVILYRIKAKTSSSNSDFSLVSIHQQKPPNIRVSGILPYFSLVINNVLLGILLLYRVYFLVPKAFLLLRRKSSL